MTKRIFGFDLGIASIGWAVVDVEKENENPDIGPAAAKGSRIVHSGVRIFTIAETPKTGESLALARRLARGARRIIRRRANRIAEIRRLLTNRGMTAPLLPQSDDVDVWKLRAVDVWKRTLMPTEMARVLIHLAKHRGFKSVRQASEEQDAEGSKVLGCITANRKELSKNSERTMAQMIYSRGKRMRNRGTILINYTDKKTGGQKQKEQNYYGASIPRAEIEREAELIFKAQNLDFFEEYKNIAFRQRLFTEGPDPQKCKTPARKISTMVGNCTFEPGQPRAAKESPSAELFVALTRINNSKIVINGERRAFNDSERDGIIKLLRSKEKVTYKDLHKIWDKGIEVKFEMVNYIKTEKKGKNGEVKKIDPEDVSFYSMKGWNKLKKEFGVDLDSLDVQMLDSAMFVIATEKTDGNIRATLQKLNIPDTLIGKFLRLTSSEFINLSTKALYKILPEMRRGMLYNDACAAVGYDFRKTGESLATPQENGLLEVIRFETNVPVVNRAVAQFRKVYNALVRKFGAPAQVNLEIGRDLKKSHDERMEIQKRNEENRTEREKSGGSLKCRLYDQQNGKSIYSGKNLEIDKFPDLSNCEIDHILPYSRSLDNSFNNKVLCLKSENQEKLNQTPYEWLKPQGKWEWFQGYINSIASLGKYKKDRLLEQEFDDKKSGEFRERNANDNAYIARHVSQYLRDGTKGVSIHVRTGSLTAFLRHQWGLDKNRGESDKHHAQDAIVVACATQSAVQYLSNWSGRMGTYAAMDKDEWDKVRKGFKEPWVGFRNEALQSLDDVFVSRPPRKNATGSAHADTINGLPDSKRTKAGLNRAENVGKGSLSVRNGKVNLENMFRFDIFKKDEKYVVIPIFVADIVRKDYKDIAYPDKIEIDDSYKFVMTLHKDDYIKITTSDNKSYEGYIIQCDMPSGKFIIRKNDNSSGFDIGNSVSFQMEDVIVISDENKDKICKVIKYDKESKKLQVMDNIGIVYEISAMPKTNKKGETSKTF